MSGKWYCGKVQCGICTTGWIAVWPEEAQEGELECPACDKKFSEVLEYYGPDEKQEIVSLLNQGPGNPAELIEYQEEKDL